MALHRDIFWLGRQWAVTGFGMQAINQKHNGQFDIPIERLWDDNLLDGVSGQKWFNPDDFSKGLAIARTRHVRPPPRAAEPVLPIATPTKANSPVTTPEPVKLISAVEVPPIAAMQAAPRPVTPPKAEPSFLAMRILAHPAKLQKVWRARRR